MDRVAEPQIQNQVSIGPENARAGWLGNLDRWPENYSHMSFTPSHHSGHRFMTCQEGFGANQLKVHRGLGVNYGLAIRKLGRWVVNVMYHTFRLPYSTTWLAFPLPKSGDSRERSARAVRISTDAGGILIRVPPSYSAHCIVRD